MRRILLVLLPLLLLVACGNDSPLEGRYPMGGGSKEDTGNKEEDPVDTPDPTVTYKILFMGNSLTLDATTLLPCLLNAAGITNIELYRTFHGAYTLPLYNENYNTTGICSFCSWKPGQDRWRGTETYDYAPADAVNANEYDIVCLQEYSGQTPAWEWNETEKGVYNGLISKINDAHPQHKPEIVALFSHTFGKDMERLVTNFDNDNTKQFQACAETFRGVLADTQIERVISPAAVVQNLRTCGLNKGNSRDMTRGDQIHSDYGLTRFAEAAVIFKDIITPLTGKKIEDNPLRIAEYYPQSTIHLTPVTDENFPIIMKAVEYASAKPLDITDMSEYGQTFTYELAPGSFWFDKLCGIQDPCTFPVVFPLNNGAMDSYKQPYWSGYGIIASTQQQAYGKWVIASSPIAGFIPTRTFANNGEISSIAIRGMWTGDYMEFVIPVKDFKAGTKIEFNAPFYTRQGPVFWDFEWLDGDEWKCEKSDITSWDGKFTRNASFAIQLGTTKVSQVATFENAVNSGSIHIRVRVADGSIQADSATSSAVERDAPYHTETDYSCAFYWYEKGAASTSISFRIKQ